MKTFLITILSIVSMAIMLTLIGFTGKLWYDSKDGIIYDKCVVIDKMDGNDVRYVSKKYVDVSGCWIRFRRVSNGQIYDRFYNNPFDIMGYEIGRTYQSEFRLKGNDIVENSLLTFLFILCMTLDACIYIGLLSIIEKKYEKG